MESESGKKKRIFVVEGKDVARNFMPKTKWEEKRFYVCHVDESRREVDLVRDPNEKRVVIKFASDLNFEWVEDPGEIDQHLDPQLEGVDDFTHEITLAVLEELGLAIIEAVIYQKNGRPSPNQLRAAFWVISLSNNSVMSVHSTSRSAYAVVSQEYELHLHNKARARLTTARPIGSP